MYKRILVPLDGLALAGAVEHAGVALAYPFSRPSIASRLVDGLEAEPKTQQHAATDGVEREGIPFSLLHENSKAEIILAVADAMRVDTLAISRTVSRY